MSSLTLRERQKLEKLFDMKGGYVLGFSDNIFQGFFSEFDVDIHSLEYQTYGTSKAKKLRSFWDIENDDLVEKSLIELIYESQESSQSVDAQLVDDCTAIAHRLLGGRPNLVSLSQTAGRLDAGEVMRQIRRMENSVESDPTLALGTAKELIEGSCKKILQEREIAIERNPSMGKLVRETLRELKLMADGTPDSTDGIAAIKRIGNNISSIATSVD